MKKINDLIEKLFKVRIKKTFSEKNNGFTYKNVFPASSYSPWFDDDAFMSTYEIIKDYTLVDIYRCYEIFTLIKQIEYIDGDVVEVGTYRGGTSGIISSVLNGFKLSKDFYAIDTFEGVVKVNHNDPSYKGGEHKASINEFKELFKKLNINLPTILTGIYPDDFPEFNIEKVCFLHIDVDIYQSAKDIYESLEKKVVSGGIILFDDYGFKGTSGVAKFCNDIKYNNDYKFIHNLNGHAIFIKN